MTDTGPLHYLIQTEAVSLLPVAFGLLAIPPAVANELTHVKTPAVVRDWMHHRPGWCSIRSEGVTPARTLRHAGERECLQLAKFLRPDWLLMDDKKGRQAALQQSEAVVIGTIGALLEISRVNPLPLLGGRGTFNSFVESLRQTNFHFSRDLDQVIEKCSGELPELR